MMASGIHSPIREKEKDIKSGVMEVFMRATGDTIELTDVAD